MKDPLTEVLQVTRAKARLRFHVPGHAGRCLMSPPPIGLSSEAFYYDVSEIDDVDVLSEPTGCLAVSQAMAASQFGVAHTFFSVNGASAALQAAMSVLLKPGDRVLVARNAHRAVISGLLMSGAEPVWVLPAYHPEVGLWGELSAETLMQAFHSQPDICGVIVTSPTYEGIASPVADLAKICKASGRFLMVDEAHGSLFSLDDNEGLWPKSACRVEADAVIHAAHKGLGSLTQTGLLHLPHGSRLSPQRVQQALNQLQSTSPSYLLLSSLDAALAWHRSEPACAARKRLFELACQTRAVLAQVLTQFQVFTLPNHSGCIQQDVSRLYVSHPQLSAEQWGPWLETTLGLAYERVSPHGALYAAGVGHMQADWRGLIEAFKHAEAILASDVAPLFSAFDNAMTPVEPPDMAMSIRDAFFADGCRLPKSQAVGRVSQETIVHCPPGIAVLVPGERVGEHHLPYLPPWVAVVL
ncbi:MAG: aminotransferase class I/II-fold pyridoxal phosphate-dependent enzyme [Vampirovibrionales bacterium]|nr:aminotransferase class I/II-fold pyridoxal phosphate-dependent enzyme [Vampirovibrionales bacterium]